MPRLVPWSDQAALEVFSDLDPHDWNEARIVTGAEPTSLSLWADWRAGRVHRYYDFVVLSAPSRGAQPFAVLGVSAGGATNVAQAALLTRVVKDWRRDIAKLAIGLRDAFELWAELDGLHRIEARSWAGHPTGGDLLKACGLSWEASLSGFGADGEERFEQHAWASTPKAPRPWDKN
ncbi:MAG: hypothetical protein AAFY65_01310 [Pseudomonadota bacterium]